MEIFGKKLGKNNIDKTEMEMVENEKDEYKLIAKYIRTKGLMLFSYNSMKDELRVVKVDKKKDAVIKIDMDGKLGKGDLVSEECNVDSRNIHFEALNVKNAIKRLKNYKEGKIKELCNLKEPSKEGIKLW
jgi:hypothetical protein